MRRPLAIAIALLVSTLGALPPAARAAGANVPRLLHLFRTATGEDEKARLCELLARETDERALRAVETALGDPSPTVRAAAARALGRRGEPSALPALRAAARDPDWRVVHAANHAVAQIAGSPGGPSVDVRVERAAERANPGHPETETLIADAITAELRELPGVLLVPADARGDGYALHGAVASLDFRWAEGWREVDCETRLLILGWPLRNILGWAAGTARVERIAPTRPRERSIRTCVEAAVQPATADAVGFMKRRTGALASQPIVDGR